MSANKGRSEMLSNNGIKEIKEATTSGQHGLGTQKHCSFNGTLSFYAPYMATQLGSTLLWVGPKGM